MLAVNTCAWNMILHCKMPRRLECSFPCGFISYAIIFYVLMAMREKMQMCTLELSVMSGQSLTCYRGGSRTASSAPPEGSVSRILVYPCWTQIPIVPHTWYWLHATPATHSHTHTHIKATYTHYFSAKSWFALTVISERCYPCLRCYLLILDCYPVSDCLLDSDSSRLPRLPAWLSTMFQPCLHYPVYWYLLCLFDYSQ